MEATSFLTAVLSGLLLGSLYCLMAMGLTVVWGVLRIFNFAHGAIVMWGAYVMWYLLIGSGTSLGYLGSFIMLIPISLLIGLAFYGVGIHPLLGRREVEMAIVIGTLALGIVLENLALLTFGPRLKRLPPAIPGSSSLAFFNVSNHYLLIIPASIGILAIVGAFLMRTKLGIAMRAVAQDKEACRLVGINVERVFAYTMALSAMLACVSGALLGSIRFITPSMGGDILMISFIVVIFGGLGSIKGTIAAGFFVGLVESFSSLFVGIYWTPPILFLVMMAVLVLRPSGLFGEKVT